ncbi:hypothetical protein B0H34DRAFT_668463 [Crassisporium funariophilum]|nr:hypothetical protein B0H34DRAFT_668463 [Crassisporium funariophilum]
MPILPPASHHKVLVTGANGYIAMWVIQALLEQGYSVRGTVRSEEKMTRLQEYFEGYGARAEWFVVEDITKEGAFDEAVEGVDAIEHMASPVTTLSDDLDEYIKPAVNGTLGVLRSALKSGTKIKRIVITSSCAAIIDTATQPTSTGTVIFNETNWGDESVKTVEEEGEKALPHIKYRASKTLSERAAWDFVEKHKHEIGWDLVVLNPPHPTLQDLKTPKDLNSSLAKWYTMVADKKTAAELAATYACVDVRDLADAHVLALRKEEAGGERIIVNAGPTTWQETRNLVHAINPSLFASGVLERGNPNLEQAYLFEFNNEKSKRVLVMRYRSLKETMGDTLADFEGRGWIR